MIAQLKNTYDFQNRADIHSTSSSNSSATTILAENSDNSEVVSRTIAAIIGEEEPTHWPNETEDQIFNNQPSVRDELEVAKTSRRARNAKHAERQNRAAQRAIDQANAAQNQVRCWQRI